MKTILFFVLIFIGLTSVGQDCVFMMQSYRSGIKVPYKYDNQSKSGLFVAGKTSEISIICQEGKDYKIVFAVSSNILKDVTISVTDESGNEYYTLGTAKTNKDIESKRQFLLNLKDQQLTIKGSKQKLQLKADIEKLELEINQVQNEAAIRESLSGSKTFFEFTPAETMNIIVKIGMNEGNVSKGCIAMIISNKISDFVGF
ncbi:MAG: hypothetical protein ABIJ97_12745 [Bacteroidota bacterium]